MHLYLFIGVCHLIFNVIIYYFFGDIQRNRYYELSNTLFLKEFAVLFQQVYCKRFVSNKRGPLNINVQIQYTPLETV